MKHPQVAGLPSTELVDVPVAVIAHVRQFDFPVFDARGKVITPGQRTARDTQMVYILADDHAELLDTLRANIGQLATAESIPVLHRAWTLQFVLRHEIALLQSRARGGDLPLGLPAAVDVLTQFVLKVGRAPHVLLQVMEEDDAVRATHSLHTAFLTVLLAHATGVRRPDQLGAIAFGAVFADAGLDERLFSLLTADGTADAVPAALVVHPRSSLEIMRRMGLTPQAAQEAVLRHHERFDGQGYPDGVGGDELPFSARCVALADYYSLASFRRRKSRKVSVLGQIAELAQHQGAFDPDLQSAFARLLRQHAPGQQFRRR